MGKIKLRLHDGIVRNLMEVRYVLDLKKNLIFVGFLESKGFKITMENGILKVSYGAFVALRATHKRNMYFLDGITIVGGATTTSDITRGVSLDTTRLWHMLLGHAGENALQSLVKQGLLKGSKTCKLEFCEHCVLGKQIRVKFDTAIHQKNGTLDYVHTNMWGPAKVFFLGGKHYYVTFVDDYSRRVWVYTMRYKDEVLDVFLKWKKLIETQIGYKIKWLKSDNGGEYKSNLFLKVCQDEGIAHQFIVKGTPQQNGVVERMNRTFLEKVRCMLSQAKLGREFWAEAITYASHIINRLPELQIRGKLPERYGLDLLLLIMIPCTYLVVLHIIM